MLYRFKKVCKYRNYFRADIRFNGVCKMYYFKREIRSGKFNIIKKSGLILNFYCSFV
jgi:hypothetical protein